MTTAEKVRQRRDADAAKKTKTAGPQRSITIRRETITPEIATAWLERNTTNRAVTQSAVDRYARDMKHGRWHLTGETIKFGWSGILLDGQNRLWACIEAGVPFETFVVRGIVNEAEVRDVIDTGQKRTLGHALQIHGEKDSNNLASIVAMCWRYQVHDFAKISPTHEEGISYLQDNPNIREAVPVGRSANYSIKASAAACGAAYYLNALADEEASREFWDGVATGENLPSGSAILAFRRWVIQTNARRDKPHANVVLIYALKAMNLWREGRSVRILHVKDGDGLPKTWS